MFCIAVVLFSPFSSSSFLPLLLRRSSSSSSSSFFFFSSLLFFSSRATFSSIRFVLSPPPYNTRSMRSIQAAAGNCDRNHLELTATSNILDRKDSLRATNRRERRYEFTES